MINFDELKNKALAKFGKIIDKSSELAGQAEDKAKLYAKISKLKIDIAKDTADADKLFTSLGKAYYALKTETDNEGILSLIGQIDLLNGKIDANKAELEALKAEDKAEEVVESAEEATADAAEEVKETAEKVAETVEDTAEAVEEVIENAENE